MKKTLSIKIAALLIAVVVAVSAPLTSKGDVLFEKGETHRVETMVTIPIGDEEGQLSIGPSTIGDPGSEPEPDAGPGCYAITINGDIFVVDTFDEPAPIVHYAANGEYIDTIPAELFTDFDEGVYQITAYGNKLYVPGWDMSLQKSFLCEYDPDTQEVIKHETPAYLDGYMTNVGDYIVFGVHAYQDLEREYWAFDTVKKEFVPTESLVTKTYSSEKQTYTIKLGESEFVFKLDADTCKRIDEDEEYGLFIPYTHIWIVGLDDAGNLIVDHVLDEVSYRKYSQESELIAYANQSRFEYKYDYGRVLNVFNGELVRSRCDGTTYELQKVIFDEEYFTAYPFDLNLDDAENTGDAALLLQNCLGTVEFDPALKCKADINKDAYVNTGDVAFILRELVKR